MLYCVQMEVCLPHDAELGAPRQTEGRRKGSRARPAARRQVAPIFGGWLGATPNVSVFDVADHDELHNILSALPLFPFMNITVIPLARHPSAIIYDGGRRLDSENL